jgi:serine/threonine protein kinase
LIADQLIIMLGKTIDGYEITQEVGRGNAAAVYVARQQPVARYVAIKVFDHLTLDSTARLRQLFDQIETIDHVNILPMYASGQTDDRVYWVMRYLPAGSLRTRSRVALEQIDRWITQIASALDYAHQHDLIHGSLKPSNVLLDHAGNAFVCDFGLAPIVGQSPTDYPLPEQRRYSKLNVQSDVYELGALAYELLTGRMPIDLRGREEDRLNWRVTLPPPPSSINSKLSPSTRTAPHSGTSVDAVILKALSIEPAQRYPSAPEFAAAFAQATGEQTTEPVRTETPPLDRAAAPTIHRVRTQRSTTDRRWIVGGIIGLLFVIGLIGLLASRSSSTVTQSQATATSMAVITPTALPASSRVPSAAPTSQPAMISTQAIVVSTDVTLTPTIAPTFTSTLRPIAATRIFFTPTPTIPITIEPLALLMPRREDRASLILLFHTHIRPDNAGPIGQLSMSVPSIEPLIKDRGLAQVGSGDQTLSVSVLINCNLLQESLTTQQILLIIRNDQGQTVYAQPLDYTKTWCK